MPEQPETREKTTKATPGPWEAHQEYANRWRIQTVRDGFVPLSVATVQTTVCEVGVAVDDAARNARLIATAPELLEACKAAIPEIRCLYNQLASKARSTTEARNVDYLPPEHAVAKALRMLNDAIAKAEGRAK